MSLEKVRRLIREGDGLMAAAVVADDLGIAYASALTLVAEYEQGRKANLEQRYNNGRSPKSAPKRAAEPSPLQVPPLETPSRSAEAVEQEYLAELKFALEQGEINPRERHFLEKIRALLGISSSRAAALEASLLRNRLFVSYSRADKTKVSALLRRIESETGESCWMDLTGIESGSQFEETIIRAIDEADIVLFMMSDSAVASSWTKREVYYAEAEGKRIVPISIDGRGLRGWVKFQF